ncbi:MAG: winged helix-turn-helix domain-containing protein [Pseudomonadota bacterium]
MILRFGDCEVDTARRELRRRGEIQSVEPQVYRLLLHLLENRHRVVTRDELLETIWKGRVVSDTAVNSRIKAARSAVGDDGRDQSCIRTLHRQGYRFVAAVYEGPSQPVMGAVEAVIPADVRNIVESAETLDNLDLSLPSQTSVAVLPFQLAGSRPSGQLLADGLTYDITTQLSRAGWLFVAARGSTFQFRAGPYDARAIGRALGVHYLVQGRVHLAGNRIRVQASLADTRDGSETWGDSFRRRIDDIFEVQQEISEVIAGALESRIEHMERRRSLLKAPASLDAWEAYHRGCWHMYRFTTGDHELAEQFFLQSIALDPNSPRAYAALSFVHWQRAFLERVPDRAAESARTMELAQQSRSLDPYDPMGHWAVGRAHLLDGDVQQAVDDLEVSVRLNPSSAVGQYSLAYALMQLGDPERSIETVSKARRLSPFDPMTFAMFGVRAQNLSFLGQHEESAVFASRAASQPNSHYHVVAVGAYCNVLAGHHDEAAGLFRRVKAARPDYSLRDFLRAFRLRRAEHIDMTTRAFRQLEKIV